MNLASFIASFGVGSAFDRVVADASRRACVRANITRSSPLSDDRLREITEECASDVKLRIVERFDYNPNLSQPSTWINSIAFYIGSNLVRDAIGESASLVHNVHADSDARPGQAWDRLIADHGLHAGNLAKSDPDSGRKILSRLIRSAKSDRRTMKFLKILISENKKDSSAGLLGRVAEKMGVSNAQISHYLTGIRETVDYGILSES